MTTGRYCINARPKKMKTKAYTTNSTVMKDFFLHYFGHEVRTVAKARAGAGAKARTKATARAKARARARARAGAGAGAGQGFLDFLNPHIVYLYLDTSPRCLWNIQP
jgi:hypothetical protein